MRIAMLAPGLGSDGPSSRDVGHDVAAALTEGLRARGVDVTLFETGCPTRTSGSEVSHPMEDRALVRSRELECAAIGEAFERADEFDLIHNHCGVLALSYARLVKRPVLTTIHERPADEILSVFKRHDGACSYVATSESTKVGQLSYLATVRNGVEVKAYPFHANAGWRVLFLGRLGPASGLREAVGLARDAKIDLVISGSVDDRDWYEREIAPSLDGERVKHVGLLDAAGRKSLFGHAMAVLLPVDVDAAGLHAAMEANACGTPVIGFSHGAAAEFITDGVNGLLLQDHRDVADALQRVTTIPRESCRRFTEEHYSSERMIEGYLPLYERIAQWHMTAEQRPWGFYEVLLHTPTYKVKRIVVLPGKRLSLQRHRHRSEEWTVVAGTALVTRNREELLVKPGEAVNIPAGTMHRVANPGGTEVAFIEVQTGDYFGEDDIERFEDDFGRVGEAQEKPEAT